jgi:acetoacetyl-CoA synthetase
MDTPLWQPSPARIEAARLSRFRREAETRSGRRLPDYAALHAWSVGESPAERADFWKLVWDFCGVIASERGDTIVEDADRMPGARWFPQARLNFAENLLRRRDEEVAIVFRNEEGTRETLSWAALYRDVARAAAAMKSAGLVPGDRVAAILPNRPEALVGMLACASIGAIWSSCSPDFGSAGIVDRFGQIEPRFLIAVDGYPYGGKRFETLGRLPEILEALPSVERCVVVPYLTKEPAVGSIRGATIWPRFLSEHASAETVDFTQLPFDHPLYILYSSGTTGRPKCIVHGAGGTLLQHLKEQRLHVDLGREDRLFYFTTCGWMMWNWLVSAIASEASLLLYDGSPSHPDPGALFRMASEEGVTVFGTSAKFLDALAKGGTRPAAESSLSQLRTLLSTGSPLAPEAFDFVYDAISPDLHLASISGGTDIVACFVLGDPTAPVWRGEIQRPALGMKVEVFDPDGNALHDEPGELVCTKPFPSLPIGFWNDPEGTRYRAAYFERYPGVWHHGDWIRETVHGGYVITGRSDAVLNPGGVRIGTSEIYRAVESLDEVVEALAVGQEWDDDVRVVLFVVLREGTRLDNTLTQRIRKSIREKASPRHVPARVLEVDDLPRTRSGKITELAVRELVHGRPVKNVEALANPEALEHFRNRRELSS